MLIRSIADIFPVSIITLLNTAIIIATRETSTGRADVGRQLAWGALGWALFPIVLAVCGVHGDLLIPVILCIVLWLIAAIILLFAKHIPLSPPEWWWHTKSGMMAIPLSAIRKYGPEIAALTIVAVILGSFWSIIDTNQPTHLLELNNEDAPIVIKIAATGNYNQNEKTQHFLHFYILFHFICVVVFVLYSCCYSCHFYIMEC